MPYVVLHSAVSADGRTDWFTPDIGLYYEMAGAFKEDCTLAGADTILKGTPPDWKAEGDVPPADPAKALLAVPDSRGRIRSWGYWKRQPYWRGIVVLCSLKTPEDYLQYLVQERIEYLIAGEDHVDLRTALQALNTRYGVQTVRVDSGGILNGVLLRAGLVDEVSLLVHPAMVGGESPRAIFRAPDLAVAEGVVQLRLKHMEQLKDGIVWLRYSVVRA